MKIGDDVYDSFDLPICVELSDAEKEVVQGMGEDESRLCVFPDEMDREEVSNWMHDFGDGEEYEYEEEEEPDTDG